MWGLRVCGNCDTWHHIATLTVTMPTKLQLLRKEQNRRSGGRLRGRRHSEEAMREESEKQFYGKLGPASPVKRIDPKTGEVVEIISTRE
jgi:hypothetical protein